MVEKWTISRWDTSALHKSTILPKKERHRKPYVHCSYENKVFKTGSRKSFNKIQVCEKQYPWDKIFFRRYENVTEENNQEYEEAGKESQRDLSDDIKVRSNFKVNHSNLFCEETYLSKFQMLRIYRLTTENFLFLYRYLL